MTTGQTETCLDLDLEEVRKETNEVMQNDIDELMTQGG